MAIHKQAAIETLKTVATLVVAGVAFYFMLEILGIALGLILMMVSLIGWFTWLTYDYYVNKFTLKEKWKL